MLSWRRKVLVDTPDSSDRHPDYLGTQLRRPGTNRRDNVRESVHVAVAALLLTSINA
jgi:hypothetical protein